MRAYFLIICLTLMSALSLEAQQPAMTIIDHITSGTDNTVTPVSYTHLTLPTIRLV